MHQNVHKKKALRLNKIYNNKEEDVSTERGLEEEIDQEEAAHQLATQIKDASMHSNRTQRGRNVCDRTRPISMQSNSMQHDSMPSERTHSESKYFATSETQNIRVERDSMAIKTMKMKLKD